MDQITNKLTGLVALGVAAICLTVVVLSLTVGVDRHEDQQELQPLSIIVHEVEPAQQPLSIAEQRPEPIKARVPVRIDLMESPEFPIEMLRRQRLQEALQIRDALELQQQMHEELNKRYRLQ